MFTCLCIFSVVICLLRSLAHIFNIVFRLSSRLDIVTEQKFLILIKSSLSVISFNPLILGIEKMDINVFL